MEITRKGSLVALAGTAGLAGNGPAATGGKPQMHTEVNRQDTITQDNLAALPVLRRSLKRYAAILRKRAAGGARIEPGQLTLEGVLRAR